MCSLKVSWSSKITPRFLTEADGVIVDDIRFVNGKTYIFTAFKHALIM